MDKAGTLPRPRLALRVGVTGHRLNKLGPDLEAAIRARLESTLREIDAGVTRAAARFEHLPYGAADPLVRLVSALAEGADRIAAETMPARWRLAAILPMPRAEYERDFGSPGETASTDAFRALLARAETVTELPRLEGDLAADREVRNRHYAALGSFLARQSDILVAVWDGRAAEGPGGTANVVGEALSLGIPVVWIDPARPEDVRRLSGFEALDIRRPIAEPFAPAILDGLLDNVLGFEAKGPAVPFPPLDGAGHDAHAHDIGHGVVDHGVQPSAWPRYMSDRWPGGLGWAIGYPALRWMSGVERGPERSDDLSASTPPGRWAPLLRDAGGGEDGAHEPDGSWTRILVPRSTWADALASYYAQLYRSAYVTVFALAGLAVPVGLTYLFLQESAKILDIKAGFVLAELVIIGAILTFVRLGTRRHWHRSWIETRELSELLRLARPLACIGALSDLADVARRSVGGRDTFPTWYARATFREMRLPSGELDGAYLRGVLRAMLDADITGQRSYHAANARDLLRVDHFLHRWGGRCFMATLAVLLGYLALWLVDVAASTIAGGRLLGLPEAYESVLAKGVKPLVTVLAASLPALGAALAGIRAQGDFADRAQRSATTHAQLVALERDLRMVLDAPAALVTPDRARDFVVTATRIMMDDIEDWRQTYVAKALQLPA